MKLNALFNLKGSKKPRKRVGRGISSGSGKTCGRGMKGQKSRSGVAIKTEGGQMPLVKRLPKRGFNSYNSIDYVVIDIKTINFLISNNRIDSTQKVTKNTLVSIGLIKSTKSLVKLLGSSSLKTIDYKLTIELDAYSISAKSIIQASGGITI